MRRDQLDAYAEARGLDVKGTGKDGNVVAGDLAKALTARRQEDQGGLMPAPAVNITTAASPVPRSSPTDTGVAYVVGMSTQGPSRLLTERRQDRQPQRLDQPLRRRVGRERAPLLLVDYDWIDTFFREGGNALYYGRVVGPTPVKASINLAGTGTTLIVTADEYGSYFNSFKIKVINGPVGGSGTRVVQLFQNDGTTLIDQTAEVATQAGFAGLKLGVAANVPCTITLGGGSGLPTVAAATVLSGGTDDRANITQTQVDAALANLFTRPRPRPGRLPELADRRPRTCRCSRTPRPTTGSRSATPWTPRRSRRHDERRRPEGGTNGSYGALYHPWVQVPTLATGGSARSVPPSALVAGKIAQNDPTVTPSQSPPGSGAPRTTRPTSTRRGRASPPGRATPTRSPTPA
jgi:hypothetical protein